MRNKQHLAKEIVQLSAIKTSYNCFLGSEKSIFEVENTTQVKQNLQTINRSLRALYEEYKLISDPKAGGKKLQHHSDPETLNPKLEFSAIMHFNADRRFRITE